MVTNRLCGNWNFDEWAREFKHRATRDLYAGRSWKRLIDLGFTENLISLGFYLACDFPDSPGYKRLAELKEENRRKLTKAKRLISRLELDRNELCDLFEIERDSQLLKEPESILGHQAKSFDALPDVEEFLSSAGWTELECDSSDIRASNQTDTDFEIHFELVFESPDETEMPEVADFKDRQMIDSLDAAIARLRHLQDKTRPDASRRTSSPTYFLALGILLIRGRAKQPLYRDYANLLNIAYQVFGYDQDEIGEDALRKTFQRFMKRHPRSFRYPIGPGMFIVPAMVLDVRDTQQKEER